MRRVVSCVLYACFTGVVWAVTHSMRAVAAITHNAHALCAMKHNVTLTINIIKVQYSARNPNLTTLVATLPKRRRVAANVVGLGFLDTAL